jgi:pre-mRNA-splicing helicase BRR2
MMIAMSKPAFLAVNQLAANKPAIIFVPSRKQCRLTTVDLLTFCAAEGNPYKFLQCTQEEIAPHIAGVEDAALAETLAHGLAFYHEARSIDTRIIRLLIFCR